MTLTALMDALRDSPAFQHKQDIAPMLRDLEAAHGAVPVGDDEAMPADAGRGRRATWFTRGWSGWPSLTREACSARCACANSSRVWATCRW